jgi:hypothetical protein
MVKAERWGLKAICQRKPPASTRRIILPRRVGELPPE